MSTPIYPQFIHSGQPNAPQMGGVRGQMLQVLDAVLSTGCCPNTVASAIIEGDLVKLTFGVTHGYEVKQFITIEGANSPLMNGKHRIVKTDVTSIHISKGAMTDVTGLLKTKLSPLDWENMFGSNDATRRAYRSKDITSSRTIMYLDASVPLTPLSASNPAQVVKFDACANMTVLGTQIDSHTQAYNDSFADKGAMYFIQAMNSRLDAAINPAIDTPWIIVGDGKFFYFLVGFNQNSTALKKRAIYMFGDMPKVSATDEFNCIYGNSNISLAASKTSTYYDSSVANMTGKFPAWTEGTKFVRDITGLTLRDAVGMRADTFGGEGTTGKGGLAALNPLTFGLVFNDYSALRNSNTLFAGVMPYMKCIPVNLSTYGDVVDLQQHGNYLLAKVTSSGSASYDYGFVGFDLMSPRKEDVLL